MKKMTMISALSVFYTPRFNWIDFLGYVAYFGVLFHTDIGWTLTSFCLIIWSIFSGHYEEKYKA